MIRDALVPLACFGMLVLTASSAQAEGSALTVAPELHLAERCREHFPEVTRNPSSAGGWLIMPHDGDDIVCLYGSLDGTDEAVMAEALHRRQPRMVIARSTGGPVSTWLTAAEALMGAVSTGVVDEACFSSCANYIAILPEQVLALPGSLIVWHGGPTLSQSGDISSGVADLSGSYESLAARTEDLYGALGINIALMDMTGRPPSAGRMAHIRATLPDEALLTPIAGYALPPDILEQCFGVTVRFDIDHPGTDRAVLDLARRRNASLTILALPDETLC